MLLLSESELRQCVRMPDAIEAVEAAFAALQRGEATLPPPVGLDIEAVRGEVHVKGAHLHGDDTFTFKVAAGFYDNPERGLPSGSGLMLVFDARTGFPLALLLDNSWLTDVRTGAAGGVAARHLAPEAPQQVLMVGAGVQARMQLTALAAVRPITRVLLWNHRPERARRVAEELARDLEIEVEATEDLEHAARNADLIITATPSREPLVDANWVGAGTHVTAVGSDGPDKQELDPRLLARADLLVVDRVDQCARLGELHHALEQGIVDRDRAVELGAVIAGAAPGRRSAEEITVADLTGVGVQDAAIAALALTAARRLGLGTEWSS